MPRKILHWKKIPATRINETIWGGESVAQSDIAEHSQELMTLFFEDPEKEKERAAAAKKKGAAGAGGGSGKKAVSLLDLKRANNIAITLSRFKQSNADIRAAILTLDDATLSVDALHMLLSLLPTADELKALRAYKGDPAKLGGPEQFLLTMAKIPKVEARIQGFIFKQEFNSRKEELRARVTAAAACARRVAESTKFKGVLEITLALGNFMNAGHQLGNAGGVSIEGVLMLSGVRAGGGHQRITLMHYLAALVSTKEPHLLDFAADLRGCREAAAAPPEGLRAELAQLVGCCDELAQTLRDIGGGGGAGRKEQDPSTATFLQIMSEFHAAARGELEELEGKVALMEERFSALARYFGEDPAAFRAGEFLGHVNAFVDQFDRCLAELRELRRGGGGGEGDGGLLGLLK